MDVRETRLLLSWAKAERYSEESRKATRSEGDDLEESIYIVCWKSATRALSERETFITKLGEGRKR